MMFMATFFANSPASMEYIIKYFHADSEQEAWRIARSYEYGDLYCRLRLDYVTRVNPSLEWLDREVRKLLEKYRNMKTAELRELPDEILHELAKDKGADGNASMLAKRVQRILYENSGEGFARRHNPNNEHRDGYFIGGCHD